MGGHADSRHSSASIWRRRPHLPVHLVNMDLSLTRALLCVAYIWSEWEPGSEGKVTEEILVDSLTRVVNWETRYLS
jgi:hypothetical protein